MGVYIAYRAETVGPVCRSLAVEDHNLKAVHEDDLGALKLISDRVVQQPAPVDPLIGIWDESQELAKAFLSVQLGRTEIVKRGLSELLNQIQKVQVAVAQAAPLAPPPIAAGPKNVLIRFGSRWEGSADIVINSAQAVRNARDKRESRRLLNGLCPTTWFRREDIHTPCVIRPRRHHAGRLFFVCNNAAEVTRAITRCGPGWYASAVFPKVKEFRVFALQDRVVRISEKFPADANEVAWNFAVGGRTLGVKKKEWPIAAAAAALKAARKLSLDWSAVDVAVDINGNPSVFEANTQPGITGKYALEQIGWAFASIPDSPIPAPLDLSRVAGWRDLIHPSLNNRADGEDAQAAA